MTERNRFDMDKVPGLKKEISLADAVAVAVGGGRIFMSKRLAPPLTFCNGRIFNEGNFIFSSDIDLYKYAGNIAYVARLFDVKLDLLHESGDHVIWSSAEPQVVNYGSERFESIAAAYEYAKPFRDRMARQWMLDHRLARRNPKEWCEDQVSRVKWKYWGIKWQLEKYFEKSCESPGTTTLWASLKQWLCARMTRKPKSVV